MRIAIDKSKTLPDPRWHKDIEYCPCPYSRRQGDDGWHAVFYEYREWGIGFGGFTTGGNSRFVDSLFR